MGSLGLLVSTLTDSSSKPILVSWLKVLSLGLGGFTEIVGILFIVIGCSVKRGDLGGLIIITGELCDWSVEWELIDDSEPLIVIAGGLILITGDFSGPEFSSGGFRFLIFNIGFAIEGVGVLISIGGGALKSCKGVILKAGFFVFYN